MRLGDLPGQFSAERGDDTQAMPIGGDMPPDVRVGMDVSAQMQNLQGRVTLDNTYTVAIYDSRPPGGLDIVIDTITSIVPVA